VKFFFSLAAAICLCACATQHVAPRFQTPSTQVVSQSQKKVASNVASAKTKAKQIEQQEKDPQLKIQIQSLQVDLDNALGELNTSSGALSQLQVQLDQQTKTANTLADNYDKAGAQITSLKVSRHRWVTYFWYSTGLLALAGVWIFRKPLLMLAAGI